MTLAIYALDVSLLDPEWNRWDHLIDGMRLAATAQLRRREDRARSIGAGLLLAYAVKQIYPAQILPLRIETDALKKPFLPNIPELHFNLSHSGKWVVCAVADQPIGIDIEKISHPMDDVIQRFFSPAERAYIDAFTPAERPAAFCELWVLKESYMKATGLGFHLPLEQLSIRPGTPPVLLRNGIPVSGKVALCFFPDPNYRLAIASPAYPSKSSHGYI